MCSIKREEVMKSQRICFLVLLVVIGSLFIMQCAVTQAEAEQWLAEQPQSAASEDRSGIYFHTYLPKINNTYDTFILLDYNEDMTKANFLQTQFRSTIQDSWYWLDTYSGECVVNGEQLFCSARYNDSYYTIQMEFIPADDPEKMILVSDLHPFPLKLDEKDLSRFLNMLQGYVIVMDENGIEQTLNSQTSDEIRSMINAFLNQADAGLEKPAVIVIEEEAEGIIE